MDAIRAEQPADLDAIRAIHLAAFPSPAEAQLVDALRAAGRLFLSRVAVFDGRVVGHAAFSPVFVQDAAGGLGLAPIAVHPRDQQRGIGSRLVVDGLAAARRAGARFVVVLGEPRFYGRFGFGPAADRGLADDNGGGPAFQALELQTGAIPRRAGLVRYAPEFALVSGPGGT